MARMKDEVTVETPVEDDGYLRDALAKLDDVVGEARAEGFGEPSEQAIENARTLVKQVTRLHSASIEVYPTSDRDVAIYAPGGQGRSVEVLCESDGGAMCLVNLDGQHRRAIYDSADMLPDAFLREGLAEIDPTGPSGAIQAQV